MAETPAAERERPRTGATPRARYDLAELAGGLGDAGLFLPIAVALIALCGLNATAVFCGVGLAYVATANYFRVPVPVQPLKAFAAAAIALHLDATTLAAGALLMSAAMALLATSGLGERLARRFPVVLVRGIQASVALLLAKAAVELAEKGNWQGLPSIDPAVSVAAAAGVCALLFLTTGRRRLPVSLVVLGVAAVVGLAVDGPPSHLGFGPQPLVISIPDGPAFATALTALVLAQIPLTFGNSIVATADAEREYFGALARRVRPGALAASIAGANLFAGLTSGLPVCHGAGGVTAHYRMGARTAGATLMVGALYVALALGLGGSLPVVVSLLPPGVLAGMLGFVAIQHGMLASRLERLGDRVLAAGIGLVTLVSGNLAIGAGAGIVALAVRGAARRAPLGVTSPARRWR